MKRTNKKTTQRYTAPARGSVAAVLFFDQSETKQNVFELVFEKNKTNKNAFLVGLDKTKQR